MFYLIISVSRKANVRLFFFHVNDDSADLWQHVLVVTKISEQVHYCVSDLSEHRLPEPDADQRTRVICGLKDSHVPIREEFQKRQAQLSSHTWESRPMERE